MRIDYLHRDSLGSIKGLLDTYQFNEYRNYRVLRKEAIDSVLLNQIKDLIAEAKGAVVMAREKEKMVGLASLAYLPWDSRIFGFKMAKIAHIISSGPYANALRIKQRLILFLLELCKKKNITQLSCRLDSADISGIHALEALGFKIMDSTVTYIFNRIKHKIPRLKVLYPTRFFRKKDLRFLLKLADNTFLKGRYYKDIYFPRDKVNRLYREWIRSYCLEPDNHRVIVAESKGNIAGFLVYKKNRELKRICKIKVFGSGLSAVSPLAKGAYPVLVKSVVGDVLSSNYDIGEFDTQLDNYEVIRVWQRFGFDFVKSKYTFHKWLKG